MMITRLLLIRHGQTDWNNARRWQGHIDIPLNQTGLDQAKLVAERLSTWKLTAVYSSDLQRASQTAQIVAGKHKLKPVLMAELRERNGGIFQGLTAAEIRSQFPEALRVFQSQGNAPPEGESNFEVAERLKKVVDRMVEDHRGETVDIVSHGGALAVLLAYALGFPLGQRARLSVGGNTGLSIIDIDDHGPRVTLLNDVSHLPTDSQKIGTGFSIHLPTGPRPEAE
jgi:broad specificity phosphatase PhoE